MMMVPDQEAGFPKRKSATPCGSATAAARASLCGSHSEGFASHTSPDASSRMSFASYHRSSTTADATTVSPPPVAGSTTPGSIGRLEDSATPGLEEYGVFTSVPPRRLYTPSRHDLRYAESPTCGPGRSSALSSRSAPSGGSRQSQRLPDAPTRASISGGSTSASRSGGIKSARGRSFSVAPAWSFRYAELMGSIVTPEDEQQKRSKRTGSKIDTVPVDSVFLAKNGRDKRLPAEEEIAMGRVKPSRYTARRPAITGRGQSRLHVKAAVKLRTKLFPEQMRRLHKECEPIAAGKGKVHVRSRVLDAPHIERLVAASGFPEDEINNLHSSFTRYDLDDSGHLDRNEARQVLGDLGLQPRGPEEKIEVNEIICDADAEGLRHYNFDEFVMLVKAVRTRLREMQTAESMLIFEEADTDGSATLDMEEAFWLLDKRLNMIPRAGDEKQEVISIFNSCDTDSDGQVGFDEFQDFVQRARAKLMQMRCEEELTIAKAFLLPQEAVQEFRMDLPQLWSIFNHYDKRGHLEPGRHHLEGGTVSRSDIVGMLLDVGIFPSKSQTEKLAMANSILDVYAKPETEFPLFLRICHELRIQSRAAVQDELFERFNNYDKHKMGELHYSQVYKILADFKMLPKSREEQQGIISVIERLDTDGSGTFDFHEFQDFFQRLSEQVKISEREHERQTCLAMGFSETQIHVVRNTFNSLNPNSQGKVTQIAVMHAVNRVSDTLCPNGVDEQSVRELTRSAQQAPAQELGFQEFVALVRSIMAKKEDELIGDAS